MIKSLNLEIANMSELYINGYSCQKIADIYNVKGSYVNYHIKKNGVKKRNTSEYRKYRIDQSSFKDPALNQSAMYWGGFLAADGNVSKSSNAITLTLAAKDIAHIEKFRRFIKSSHPITETKYGTYQICVHSGFIAEDLHFFGISPNKSLVYDPPVHCIWDKDFWRGMIDGDGFVSEERGYARMGLCGTDMMLQKFEHFVKNITNTNACVRKSNNIKMFHLKGTPAKDVLKYLYFDVDANCVLDRKLLNASKFFN